ncbi:MAG: hypothetical protein JWM59_4542, partial [Verrucomicrobiales bacterium]|nr:hypothetical protein [Verrucomicrobiales bacterium]
MRQTGPGEMVRADLGQTEIT